MGQNDFNGEDATGEYVTDLLHVKKSLSALGDVLSSLTSKKEMIPYENSRLTRLLEDSIGGSSKTLLIVNVCPNASNLPKTLSALTFSARARSAELSLGNRDTIKKCRDVSENLMLSEKHKIEKDRNTQLRNQVAHILQLEQDQKIQIQKCDSTIQKQVHLNIWIHICKL
ncbi:kinesin-like protein KIN-14B isoform X1 [Papaver somniferum]|uniref:kinesin-like protein KIN-14B isoform X1 n=1 Tax=Papaver somniferum TaxID=3469 RepID=UPI000E6FC1E1|nr:kinesin-like protein KIN-14B isoform X1 [Papaver somniferum]XP_026424369.1 kinesin-like protein KIN-14B isoform X1 [Papaver somniferum]XP_026424370.1 kinesin-like protein KIN-14B isoform X1 [Papaver somniferum]XP_026424371.1 kinesin-like protein KIN-14B isoform X1 [Papaver somniferum]XP_026424372.1 kinesin-like protein KIN-14B isoform X1 [Papaver somniferum]XP_026424373.1 kinesin-like protein KIN-14B isoform X1 [Papaver somniferum]XP_026424374.1 kinesin-like protein KIN-14B isoform X1 [Pap